MRNGMDMLQIPPPSCAAEVGLKKEEEEEGKEAKDD